METINSHYTSFSIAVPKEYKKIFSHFYFAENTSSDIVSKTFLPSYQTILIFNFGEKAIINTRQHAGIIIDNCIVLGPIKQAFTYSLPQNGKVLVGNFKNDAFYHFFGEAATPKNLPANPDNFFGGNCFAALWTELNKIENVHQQVDFILDFCKPYQKNTSIIAERMIDYLDANVSVIKSLAIEQNISERSMQIMHKKYLGYTSKEVSRYHRFIKAIALIQNSNSFTSKIDWFEIINECGYYDQSQLIHDFNYYLNISPTKYLKSQQDICIAQPN